MKTEDILESFNSAATSADDKTLNQVLKQEKIIMFLCEV